MRRHHGDDQVARAVGEGGIWNFETPLPPLFVELARRSAGTVVDVGANTGLYSLLAVAATPSVHVHAVEATPAVVTFLEQNLMLNRLLARRVHVHQLALCERSGTAMLFLPVPSGTTIETSASLDPTFKEEVTNAIEVPASTFDDVWVTLGRPVVGLVKVDTEGTEHLVLRGMRRALESSRPVVVCEVLPRGAMDELTAGLTETDYVDVRLRRDALVVSRTVEFDQDAWNHALVPCDKVPMLEEAANAIGLPLRDGRRL